jgi:ligand-binding sensor domain-containing protein
MDTRRSRAWFRCALACALFLAPPPAIAGWQSFGKGEGLPVTSITTVSQDLEGSIWFGSSEGVVTRYDGVTWTTYHLPSNFAIVHAVLEQRNGSLWVATSDGLYRLEGASFASPAEIFPGQWTCLAEDRDGLLWAGTVDGVARYDGATVRWYGTFSGLPSHQILDLAVGPDGSLLTATTGGLARFNGVDWSPVGGGGPSEGKVITRVAFDASGSVWVAFKDLAVSETAAGSGVARFDGASWTSYTAAEGLPSTRVSAVRSDAAGRIWVATLDAGIATLEGGKWRRFGPPEGLPSLHASDLIVDRHGALWVGTEVGAGRFDGEAWTAPSAANGWPTVPIRSIAQSLDGSLWFATQGDGVYRLNGNLLQHFGAADSLGTDSVSTVAATPDGSLWLATGLGLAQYANGVWRRFAAFSPIHIAVDVTGRLVFRSGASVFRQDGASEFTRIAADPAYYEDEVLLGDRDGRLLLSSANSGVRQLAPGDTVVTSVGLPPVGETGSRITIGEDADGIIWVSGNYQTVRQDGDSWRTVSRADGLLDGQVLSITGDLIGSTWFGFAKGIARDLEGEWSYDTTPGRFDSTDARPILQAQDGSLYVGSRAGWLRYERDRAAPHAVVLPPGPPRLSPNPTQAFSFAGAFREVNGIEFSTSLDSEPWTPWSSSTLWVGSGLADGPHRVVIRTRDRERNIDPYPPEVVFEIDATPPAPVISSPVFGGSVAGVATVRGSALDARFLSYRVEVTPAGVPWPGTVLAASTAPPTSGDLATWDTASYPDGDYDLRLSVTDSLGLVGASQITVIVDNAFPYVEQTAPTSVTSSGGDIYTADRALHLYFSPGTFPTGALVSITTEQGEADTLATGAAQVSPAFDLHWSRPLLKPVITEFAIQGAATSGDAAVYRDTGSAGWTLAGGTMGRTTIALAVSQPGRYALFAGGAQPLTEGGHVTDLSFSPRVFSPSRGFATDHLSIGFTLGRAAPVTVRIYNRAGRLVRELAANEELPAGSNVVRWDGQDRGGVPVVDGIYIATVQSMGETRRGTVAVVR